MALNFFRKKPPTVEPIQHYGLADQVEKRFRLYPSYGMDAERLRQIMMDADFGYTSPYMEYLDDVSNDPHIGMLFRKLKSAVAGAPSRLLPCDKSSQAKAIADAYNAYEERFPDARQLKYDMLDAVFRGFALFEPKYEYVDGFQEIIGWAPFESRFLRFDSITREPLLITRDHGDGIPLLPYIQRGDLWFPEWRDKPGEVVRGGLGRSLGRIFLYKTYTIVDGASFMERFGHLNVTVEYPKHLKPGDAQLEDIKEAVKSMTTDMVGIFPEGTKLQVIDSINRSSTIKDVYVVWMDALDQQATKAVLHNTMTTGRVAGQGGGYADAQVGQEIEQGVIEDRGNWLEKRWIQYVIRPWVLRNYGPGIKLGCYKIDVDPVEDAIVKANRQKIRAETIQIAVAAGLPVGQTEGYKQLDITPPADGEELMKATNPPKAVSTVGDLVKEGAPPAVDIGA